QVDRPTFEADRHRHGVDRHRPGPGDVLHAPPVLAGGRVVAGRHRQFDVDPTTVSGRAVAGIGGDERGDLVALRAGDHCVVATLKIRSLHAEVVDVDALR